MTDFIQRLISRAVEPVEVLLPRPASLFEPATGPVPLAFGARGDTGGDGWTAPGEAGWETDAPTAIASPRESLPAAELPTRWPDRPRGSEMAGPPASAAGFPGDDLVPSAIPAPPTRRPWEVAVPPTPVSVDEATRQPSPVSPPPAPVRSGTDRRIGDDGVTRRLANDRDARSIEPMRASPPLVRETIIREVPAGERRVGRAGPGDGQDDTLPEIIRRMVLQPVRREEVRERVVEQPPGPAASMDRAGPPPAPMPGVRGRRDERAASEAPRLEPAPRRRAEPPPMLTPRAERPALLDTPPPVPAAPPTIHVRIGRIEVRATPEGASAPPPPPPPGRAAVMTLDEYLAAGARRGG